MDVGDRSDSHASSLPLGSNGFSTLSKHSRSSASVRISQASLSDHLGFGAAVVGCASLACSRQEWRRYLRMKKRREGARQIRHSCPQQFVGLLRGGDIEHGSKDDRDSQG